MQHTVFAKLTILIIIGLAGIPMILQKGAAMDASPEKSVELPAPRHESSSSLEQTILNRRSERSYKDAPLALQEISQLLWSAQGVTDRRGFRSAPSAGALYPLEVFVAAGNVNGIEPGIYRYLPEAHAIKKEVSGDKREDLWAAGLRQSSIRRAPAVFIISAVFERTMSKYAERGRRYVFMEAGHAAQNLCLQTEAMGLAAVPIGAFDDSKTAGVLGLSKETKPLYLLPVGKRD